MAVVRNAKKKTAKKKAGGRRRKPVPRPRRGHRVWNLLLRTKVLARADAVTAAKAFLKLDQMMQLGRISRRDMWRVFEAPMNAAKKRRMLESFVNGKLAFSELMEKIKNSYSKRKKVPDEKVKHLLRAKGKLQFWQRLCAIRQVYRPPYKFIMGITLRKIYAEIRAAKAANKPRRLKRLEGLIWEANRIKNQIHNMNSSSYHATGRIDKALAANTDPAPADLELVRVANSARPALQREFMEMIVKKIN